MFQAVFLSVYRSAEPSSGHCSWIQQSLGWVIYYELGTNTLKDEFKTCKCDWNIFLTLLPLPSSGQTTGPGSQQTSNPDYNAWVDFYRQPMAYFNQGAQQTQAPGLQVRSNCLYSVRLFCSMFWQYKSVRILPPNPIKRPKQTMCQYFLTSIPWLSLKPIGFIWRQKPV